MDKNDGNWGGGGPGAIIGVTRGPAGSGGGPGLKGLERVGEAMKNGNKQASGFTKREAFAMAAMEGDWASQGADTGEFHNGMGDGEWDARTELYVKAANALLKALEEE